MPERAPPPPRIEHPDLRQTAFLRAAPPQLVFPGGRRPPVSPGDPGYKERLPPPGRDDSAADQTAAALAKVAGQEQQVEATATNGHIVAAPEKRIVVGFGPKEGTVIVGVEESPDWDLVGDSVTVTLEAVKDVMPILQQLARVKNMTGTKL